MKILPYEYFDENDIFLFLSLTWNLLYPYFLICVEYFPCAFAVKIKYQLFEQSLKVIQRRADTITVAVTRCALFL